jgi:hypothetical protein
VAADDIFVLFLIVAFVGAVVALSLHSRRLETATDSSEAPPVPAAAEMSEPVSTEGEPPKNGNRAERRRSRDG